jgi:chromosome segregation ATPase
MATISESRELFRTNFNLFYSSAITLDQSTKALKDKWDDVNKNTTFKARADYPLLCLKYANAHIKNILDLNKLFNENNEALNGSWDKLSADIASFASLNDEKQVLEIRIKEYEQTLADLETKLSLKEATYKSGIKEKDEEHSTSLSLIEQRHAEDLATKEQELELKLEAKLAELRETHSSSNEALKLSISEISAKLLESERLYTETHSENEKNKKELERREKHIEVVSNMNEELSKQISTNRIKYIKDLENCDKKLKDCIKNDAVSKITRSYRQTQVKGLQKRIAERIAAAKTEIPEEEYIGILNKAGLKGGSKRRRTNRNRRRK